jgi:protein-tyrosine-phosphatase
VAHPPEHLRLDQQQALRTAAEWLVEEFGALFGVETIERFLQSSYAEFAEHARLTHFLPLIAQRFARQRLRALAMVQGHGDGRPTVLFLCAHNAARSQMAMGFFRHHANGRAVAWSGGSFPGDSVDLGAISAMAERGIDIAGEYAKPWTDEIVRAADVVITMGCGDACPVYDGTHYEEWVLDDPEGAGIETVRTVRDEIERRVLVLLDDLGIGPAN